jgi:hypothetical protein
MRFWLVASDLLRRRCWTHTGCIGSGPEGKEYTEDKPTRLPWFTRMKGQPLPWFGGDEWCRWTLVLPLPRYSLVIPLWECRNPNCESCQIDCIPIVC